MPKFYCDYCDIYLAHSSIGGRRQHCIGRKHIQNKIEFYQNVVRDIGPSGAIGMPMPPGIPPMPPGMVPFAAGMHIQPPPRGGDPSQMMAMFNSMMQDAKARGIPLPPLPRPPGAFFPPLS